jgi:hypothetical protein
MSGNFFVAQSVNLQDFCKICIIQNKTVLILLKKYHTTVSYKLPTYRRVEKFHYIATDCVVSASHLLTDKKMLHHIKKCSEAKGKWQLGDDTSSALIHEIEAFASILYGRGA